MNETDEGLVTRARRATDAVIPRVSSQMELLIQAARIDPVLRKAAIDVDAALFAKDQLINELSEVVVALLSDIDLHMEDCPLTVEYEVTV